MTSRQQKTYDRQTAKFLAAIGENVPTDLTSEQMQAYIQHPKQLQKALGVLSLLLLGNDHAPILPWREFVIGGMSENQLISALEPYSCDSNWPHMMRHPDFVTLAEPHSVLTTIVTPKMLGFVKTVKLLPILARARECGLWWHPSLAAHVRYQHQDDKEGDCLYFPMEPILDNERRPSIFAIDRNDDDAQEKGGRWFWAMPGNGDYDQEAAYQDAREREFGLDTDLVFIVGEPKPIIA